MFAWKLKKSDKPPAWKAAPAQVWTIAIMLLFMQNPLYSPEMTSDVTAFVARIKAAIDHFDLGSEDHKWLGVVLQAAYFKGEASPEEILEILPSAYQKRGKYSTWGKWFSKILCEPEKRYTLKEAWKAYQDLGLEETHPSTPSPIRPRL